MLLKVGDGLKPHVLNDGLIISLEVVSSMNIHIDCDVLGPLLVVPRCLSLSMITSYKTCGYLT